MFSMMLCALFLKCCMFWPLQQLSALMIEVDVFVFVLYFTHIAQYGRVLYCWYITIYILFLPNPLWSPIDNEAQHQWSKGLTCDVCWPSNSWINYRMIKLLNCLHNSNTGAQRRVWGCTFPHPHMSSSTVSDAGCGPSVMFGSNLGEALFVTFSIVTKGLIGNWDTLL